MKRELARAQALALMEASQLDGWRFRFDTARRRAGSCIHSTRTITLSGPLTELYDADTVRAVILHEIAHALVGAQHHHDAVWKRTARALGAPDSARLSASLPRPEEPWVGTCPRCGGTRRLFRTPRRVTACGACAKVFRPERILQWTYKGVPTEPGGAYARELRQIQARHAQGTQGSPRGRHRAPQPSGRGYSQ